MYRAIPVHLKDKLLLGVLWCEETFVDDDLPFGHQSSLNCCGKCPAVGNGGRGARHALPGRLSDRTPPNVAGHCKRISSCVISWGFPFPPGIAAVHGYSHQFGERYTPLADKYICLGVTILQVAQPEVLYEA